MSGEPKPDNPQPAAGDARLVNLRRLYHHVIHGGRTNESDRQLVGGEPTADAIHREIVAEERRQGKREGWL